MNCLEKYFKLTDEQKDRFNEFSKLFKSWNSQINLISRKDIEFLCVNHVLHSLSIAKYIDLTGKKIIDVGTGGGFPGIPLAIMFPQSEFLLIDSIGKKIMVVDDIIKNLDLENVKTKQIRSNELKDNCDIIVARAVTSFPKFYLETKHLLTKKSDGKNGIIYLKGEDYEQDTIKFADSISATPIDYFFKEDYFKTKFIVHYKI